MINIDNKKINAIKLGTDNYKKAYVGNDLVFQQGKWVFYKKVTVHESNVPGYSDEILDLDKEAPNGGKFLIMLSGTGEAMVLSFKDIALFVLQKKAREDNEAYVLDIKKLEYYNYSLTIEWGKFDISKKRFYDGHIYEKDKHISQWIQGYPLNNEWSEDIDIYKWQEG